MLSFRLAVGLSDLSATEIVNSHLADPIWAVDDHRRE
jgi:hypothetical protein